MRPRPAMLALCAACLATPCAAADPPRAPIIGRGSVLQLIVENDKWAGTDRYYTNGVKIGLGASERVSHNLVEAALQLPALQTLRGFSGSDARVQFGAYLGQNLYTPRSITAAAPQPFDRPWAAWLYLGGVAQLAEERRLDTAEFDIGVVGPAALGREVHTAWHGLIDAPRPRGWSNQLPNEPAFQLSYLHKRKAAWGPFELIPHVGVTAGSVLTAARLGGVLRVGRNMTGFGPDGIEPGGAMLQNTRWLQERGRRGQTEVFGFVGLDFRLVGRNIFLDGTMLRDSPGVKSRDLVRDFQVGFGLRYGAFRLSITRVARSEEFRTPAGGGGSQVFHSINLGWEF